MRNVLIVCLVGLTGLTAAVAQPGTASLSIPYVPTRSDTVKDMLWMADVGTNDVVYDLGSGDGRIVIAAVRDFHARKAVGIEINPELVRQSRRNAQQAGVADRVHFIQGDLFTNDFSQASVVTLYLGHQENIRLRSQIFRRLKPGTRIVAHKFGMGEWQPDKQLSVRTVYLGMCGEMDNPFAGNPRTPDYGSLRGCGGGPVSMWVVPASVAGIWRGKLPTTAGGRELTLVLHQRLSEVTGTFQVAGQSNVENRVWVDLWGDHLRYSGLGYARRDVRPMFDGRVDGDMMRGTLAVFENDGFREFEWEARRDAADFTGTWEWAGSVSNQPVRLQLKRRDGQVVASYMENGRTVPIADFYDWGGGFYFTLFLGREGNTIRISPNTGWLIAEGIVEEGSIKGKVEFYPYPDWLKRSEPPRARVSEWYPRRITP